MVNAPKKAAHRSLFSKLSSSHRRIVAMTLGASRRICAVSKAKAKARPPSPVGQFVFVIRGGKGKGKKGQSKGKPYRVDHGTPPPRSRIPPGIPPPPQGLPVYGPDTPGIPPPPPPGSPVYGPDTSLDETDKDFLVYLEAVLKKMYLPEPEDEDVREELLPELRALIAKTC